jgi:phage repressor protein C with HTH and peptisase S24 domain
MEPVFKHGDKIIVAPSLEAKSGQAVVARFSDTGAVLFKILTYVGKRNERVRLSSYNPDYPPIEFPKRAFRLIQPVYTMVRKVMV